MQLDGYKVDDFVEYNSDPESDNEDEHTHNGKIIHFNLAFRQITFKSDDRKGTISSYYLGEIEINCKKPYRQQTNLQQNYLNGNITQSYQSQKSRNNIDKIHKVTSKMRRYQTINNRN